MESRCHLAADNELTASVAPDANVVGALLQHDLVVGVMQRQRAGCRPRAERWHLGMAEGLGA
ncbi:MAG: hypothetical protein AAFX41_04900, partial [Bacteroidota bacterium]